MLPELLQEEKKRIRIEARTQKALNQRPDNVWRSSLVVDNGAVDKNNIVCLEKNREILQKYKEQKIRNKTNSNFNVPSRNLDRVAGPVQFVLNLLATWNLEKRDAAWLLGFEEVDELHVENIMSGRTPLMGRDIKDRIACLFQIRRALSVWLQDDAVENEWLREPHLMLDSESPIDMLREGSMENLFAVREYVEMATGG